MNKYQKEQNELINFLLQNLFINNKTCFDLTETAIGCLELFITPECNQICEYCYFYKYGKELYPKEFLDTDIILNNLKLLLDYLQEKEFKCKFITPFAGEIWSEQLGQECLKIILNKLKEYHFTDSIVLCSNMTFIENENTINFFRWYVNELSKINVSLHFSASIEGKYLDDKFRKRKNGSLRTEEFYNKLYDFAGEFIVGYHPMIYSKSAKYWKENYKWFKDNMFHEGDSSLWKMMTLEVRNDDWTDEDIQNYCEFLEYGFDLEFGEYKNNPLEIIKKLYRRNGGFNVFKLTESSHRMACSIQACLFVRLGDLAWIPCHRTCYPENIYGKFKVEDNKITELEAYNTDLAVFINTLNPNFGMPGCDSCKYKHFCAKGCLGAQLEASNDMTLPCASVCKLEKAKINKLIEIYEKYGIIDCLKNTDKLELNNDYYINKNIPILIDKLQKDKNTEEDYVNNF